MFSPDDISYHIVSLGCSKNLVDSERINGGMSAAGFRASAAAESADIVIINTCGFIEDAKRESIDAILQAADLKDDSTTCAEGAPLRAGARSFPKKLAVVGCLSKRYREDLARDMPEIDFLYGVVDDDLVPSLCRAMGIRPAAAGRAKKPIEEGLPYRYIKISDGCSNLCSYCAIPLIRGPHVPFPPDAIMDDVRAAVDGGAKELVMVAQDTAAYRHGRTGLADLVYDAARVPGVEWIRLMYCHPDHIDRSIIELVRDCPAVVKYLDIPFQHANGEILASMGRKGNAASYLALVETLRAEIPSIRIRSTFMTGYPGEGERAHRALADFLKSARLDKVGFFTYSPEEDTPAAGLGAQVPHKTRRSRYRALMRIQKNISLGRMGALVGATLRVLVEERIDERTWCGRSEYDAPEVDGVFYLTADFAEVNTIVSAKVTDSLEYDLIGVLA
ncbi:MAG: 30S ribosomal protein S12 methylthiotransferase RimO [Spirochaetes bacterium]|nr:MAG: 30S ribosomal protein S12 methylthiotransferase RimO [Spirochaetota bacterium]